MLFLTHHLQTLSAKRNGAAEAIVFGDTSWSYEELDRRSTMLAKKLVEQGVTGGERVAIFLPPGLELVQSILAVSKAGGVFVPVHHNLLDRQVSHIVGDCGVRVLVTSSEQALKIPSVFEQCSLQCVVCTDGHLSGVSLPQVTFAELADDAAGSSTEETKLTDHDRSECDLAAILYTSGSTGPAKGVMLSHRNVIAGAEIVADYLSITSDDRILAALPFSFDAGLNQLTSSLLKGGTLVLSRFKFGKDIVDQFIRHEITGLAGVPTLWCLLTHPRSTLAARCPEKLRYITNTGGVMPRHVLSQLRESMPHTDVFLMYGLTEAFRSTYLSPAEIDRRPGSMGKAIPNTEILVVNEKGESCKAGETGELVHHGPTVAMGYWGQPELTERVFRDHPQHESGTCSSRVVYSGDLVRRDEDGFLYFVSRRDNMIKTSGYRVSPSEVEEGLCATDLVSNVAVVGVPDEVLGQHIVAYIEVKQDAEIDTARLRHVASEHLPAHMIPKRIEVMDSLPKNSSGKVNYAWLRQHASGEVGP